MPAPAPVSPAPASQEPLPQAWVPRVMDVLLAVVLLALVSPILTRFGGKPAYVQAALVLSTLPVVLVAGMCLSSAARPGSLGRAVRRLRGRSRRR